MRCPICSGDSYREWGRVGEYSIVMCRGCGLGVTSPFPTEERIRETNQDIYQVEQRIRTYISRKKYFENRYKRQIAAIKQFVNAGTLLDVGCNIGLFLKVAREEGFSVNGVELNQGCAEYGQKNFELDICSDYLEKIAFADESFDVVTLFDVLEHIPDIHGFLSEVRRILRKNGLLVVQSPNFNSLMARMTGSKWYWLTPPDHVYHFTPETLQVLLKKHGFDIRLLKTWEPAEEFSNNLLSVYSMTALFAKAFIVLNQLTKLLTLPVFLIQKLWWRKQMGGLIELYAVKKQ